MNDLSRNRFDAFLSCVVNMVNKSVHWFQFRILVHLSLWRGSFKRLNFKYFCSPFLFFFLYLSSFLPFFISFLSLFLSISPSLPPFLPIFFSPQRLFHLYQSEWIVKQKNMTSSAYKLNAENGLFKIILCIFCSSNPILHRGTQNRLERLVIIKDMQLSMLWEVRSTKLCRKNQISHLSFSSAVAKFCLVMVWNPKLQLFCRYASDKWQLCSTVWG